jgi:UDP-N-acetylglucosamine:LPS N-acetylglucosamine transferase
MIGKLGSLTTNECLIKYLPIIVPFKPPYHEYWNMKFLEKEGVIKVIDGYKNLPNGIDELVENPSILEKIKANMEHLRKPNACKDMAEKIKNVTDGNS